MLRPGATALLVLLATGCSGGMQETETEEVQVESGGSTTDSTATTDEIETETTDSEATSAIEEEPEEDYLDRLSTAVRSGWTRPNRPGNVSPRSARVVVFFGPRGVLQRWQFRRRSSHELYNRVLEEYLNDLVGSPRQFPLPRRGTALFEQVMSQGAIVEFADPDG